MLDARGQALNPQPTLTPFNSRDRSELSTTPGDGRQDVYLSTVGDRCICGPYFFVGDGDHDFRPNAAGIDDESAEAGELAVEVGHDLAEGRTGGLQLGSAAGLTSEWSTDVDGGHVGF